MAKRSQFDPEQYDCLISVDPARQGGRPCVAGTRVPTETIAAYVWWDGAEAAADDYRIHPVLVAAACWFEWQHHDGRTKRGKWAAKAHRCLAQMEYHAIPEPPSNRPETDR